MTKKIILWLFLGFCVLVGINYLSTAVGNAFRLPFSYGDFARADEPGKSLSSIDFSIFDKGGVGDQYISQGYGRTPWSYMYLGDWHNGIDIAAVYGAAIYAPGAGVVLATGNQDDYCPLIAFGRYVVVDDPTNHLILLFAHLGYIAVSPGENVKDGTEIGSVGSTGLETGTHLHFSIFEEQGFSMAPAHGCGPYPQGHDVDPLNYLGTTYK